MLVEKLKKWGCETEKTYKRLCGNVDFYAECLNDVVNDEYFTELGEALNDGNTERAFKSSHALKGALSNMGLTPMYNKLVEIVEPLRVGDSSNIISKYNELMAMKDYLRDILASEQDSQQG